jgi:N-terminal region of Chorein or VPS13
LFLIKVVHLLLQFLGAMFKSSVAWVLNKYLGKYVQDLDTENLNVGIFNGEVQLHDLKLKPEALVRDVALLIYLLSHNTNLSNIYGSFFRVISKNKLKNNQNDTQILRNLF